MHTSATNVNQTVKLKLHPDFKDRGFREYKVKDSFYLEKEELKNLKAGKINRLMDCLNFKILKNQRFLGHRKSKGFSSEKGQKFVFDSLEHTHFNKKSGSILPYRSVSARKPKLQDTPASCIKSPGQITILSAFLIFSAAPL